MRLVGAALVWVRRSLIVSGHVGYRHTHANANAKANANAHAHARPRIRTGASLALRPARGTTCQSAVTFIP